MVLGQLVGVADVWKVRGVVEGMGGACKRHLPRLRFRGP